jgi:hypothetical protein
MLSLMMLLLAAGSAQAAVLRAGAHGRANIVDPGRAIPALPQTGSGGLGTTGIAASLVGLAAVLALVSVAGNAGWQSGEQEAFARQLSASRLRRGTTEGRTATRRTAKQHSSGLLPVQATTSDAPG